MKKVILILFPLLVLGGLYGYLYKRDQRATDIVNTEKKALEFKDNTIMCPQCFMYLVGKKHTVQWVDKEGKTSFFDDIGCMILWSKAQKINLDDRVIWVYSLDTVRYIDAKKAYFSLTDETPMNYGFGAYENNKEGMINFEEMRLRMLRGENLSDPKVRKALLLKGY